MTATGDGFPPGGTEGLQGIGSISPEERRRRAVLLGAAAAAAVVLLIGLVALLVDSDGERDTSSPSSSSTTSTSTSTSTTSTSTTTTSPPATTVPDAVADAGPDRSVDRGSRVRLEARGVEGIPEEAIRWTQTFGPDVTGGSGVLTGPVIGFDAPLDVSSVVFSLEVGGADASATDEVLVRVFEDVTSAVFVDSESGIAQADGSMGAPYASIRAALELAAGQDVYIRSVGRYDESEATVTLGAEVSMYGGFVEGWRRDVSQRTAIDVGPIGIAVSGSGERWLSALDLTVADAPLGGVAVGVFVEDADRVHIADSRIVGGAAGGGDVLLTGKVSVGVRAERVAVLIIERSTIHAGPGGVGNPPFPPEGVDEAPESGLDGDLPDGGSGGAVDEAMPDAEHRVGADGGDGGDEAGSDGESGDDSADASGGLGGSAGEEDEPDSQLAGAPGAGGGGGSGGGGGDGGLGTGTDDDTAGSTGSTGGAAQPGGGGAGGGGGAVASVDEPEAETEPEPEPEPEELRGGGGGGGGAGGVPGTPGAGGGGGGGSIGLSSIDGDRLIIVESLVAGGRGGDGADGAVGAAGQAGSAAGNGAVPDADDDRLGVGGGAGGGGAGGTGGGGGGGAGGPSIGLLTSDVGTVELRASTVLGGGGGAGAAGGAPGADGAAGAVGESTFGGLGGIGDLAGEESTARSSAVAGVGATGGASVGWLDTGGATLVGDESSFESGAGGPGGAGSSPGAAGPSTDISG